MSSIKILSHELDSPFLVEDSSVLKKISYFRKAFFSLNCFDMKPNGLNLFLWHFVFLNYGLEFLHLRPSTVKKLNISQNNLFQYILKLPRSSHMTKLLIVRTSYFFISLVKQHYLIWSNLPSNKKVYCLIKKMPLYENKYRLIIIKAF